MHVPSTQHLFLRPKECKYGNRLDFPARWLKSGLPGGQKGYFWTENKVFCWPGHATRKR